MLKDKYKYIKNPLTNKKVKIESKIGREIIKKYYNVSINQSGGFRWDINQNHYDGSLSNDCEVCMTDDFNDLEFGAITIVKPCGHAFHESCITDHIQRNGANCPVCRAAITDLFQIDKKYIPKEYGGDGERHPRELPRSPSPAPSPRRESEEILRLPREQEIAASNYPVDIKDFFDDDTVQSFISSLQRLKENADKYIGNPNDFIINNARNLEHSSMNITKLIVWYVFGLDLNHTKPPHPQDLYQDAYRVFGVSHEVYAENLEKQKKNIHNEAINRWHTAGCPVQKYRKNIFPVGHRNIDWCGKKWNQSEPVLAVPRDETPEQCSARFNEIERLSLAKIAPRIEGTRLIIPPIRSELISCGGCLLLHILKHIYENR